MIVYPQEWHDVGQPILLSRIENTLLEILADVNCNCLAFSGGLDSTVVLHAMLQVHDNVKAFTIGFPPEHPDIEFSKLAVEKLNGNIIHKVYIPTHNEVAQSNQEDSQGDNAVRLFYQWVAQYTDSIIACDGIDEFMGGYYQHQNSPNEKTYYDILRELQTKHLVSLDENSGKVKVYLPYLDNRLILLLAQIPLEEKVDYTHRKKVMASLAKDKIPQEIIDRRKFGFCSAILTQGVHNEKLQSLV